MRLTTLLGGLLLTSLAGCTTTVRQGPSFAAGFDVPESDGVLIEWHNCTETAPCIAGRYQGQSYALGFQGSPGVVAGQVGGLDVRFELDPSSIFRLGDHALELTFAEQRGGTVLDLTWNELDQEPIAAELIPVHAR